MPNSQNDANKEERKKMTECNWVLRRREAVVVADWLHVVVVSETDDETGQRPEGGRPW